MPQLSKQKYSFFGPALGTEARPADQPIARAFDFDKAAKIIRKYLLEHPLLPDTAGLKDDWSYTSRKIFSAGSPCNDDEGSIFYGYLASTWAIPCIILSWDGEEQVEEECWSEVNERFHAYGTWDNTSLNILRRK